MEEDPLEWARALEELAGRAAARVRRDCAEGEVAVREARGSLEYGTALADRRRRHAEALTRSRTVEETAEERVDLQATLTEAARADRLLPLIQGAEQRAEAATKACRLAADAVARALPSSAPAGIPARTSWPRWSATAEARSPAWVSCAPRSHAWRGSSGNASRPIGRSPG
ncbi:hypothetical protein ACFQX6_63420 [Streptosporangium lutulentum]